MALNIIHSISDGSDSQSVASSDLYVDDSDIASLDSRDSFYMDPPSSLPASCRPSPKHEPNRGMYRPSSWDQLSSSSSNYSGSFTHLSPEERLSLAMQAKSQQKLLLQQQQEEEERMQREVTLDFW